MKKVVMNTELISRGKITFFFSNQFIWLSISTEKNSDFTDDFVSCDFFLKQLAGISSSKLIQNLDIKEQEIGFTV